MVVKLICADQPLLEKFSSRSFIPAKREFSKSDHQHDDDKWRQKAKGPHHVIKMIDQQQTDIFMDQIHTVRDHADTPEKNIARNPKLLFAQD